MKLSMLSYLDLIRAAIQIYNPKILIIMSVKEVTMHTMHMYEVSDVSNYSTYKDCFGFLVSEPRKYVGTHILIWMATLLFYIVTAFKTVPGMVALVVICNVIV